MVKKISISRHVTISIVDVEGWFPGHQNIVVVRS